MVNKKNVLIILILIAITWLISLFIKVNVPQFKEGAQTYVDIVSFVGFAIIIFFLFKKKR